MVFAPAGVVTCFQFLPLSAFFLNDDEDPSRVIFHNCESGLVCCLEPESSTPLLKAAMHGLLVFPPGKCVSVRMSTYEGSTGDAQSTVAS